MDATTSRRALLGVIGLAAPAAALAASQCVAQPAQALSGVPAGPSRQLLDLIAAWDRADAAIDAFYAAEFNSAHKRYDAARAAIPHTQRQYMSNAGPMFWSTADEHSVLRAKGIARIPNVYQHQGPAWQETRRSARSLYAAHLLRERAMARAYRDSGAAAADVKEQAMWDDITPVRASIESFPVASIADMSVKMAFMARIREDDDDISLALVRSDLVRLAAGGLN